MRLDKLDFLGKPQLFTNAQTTPIKGTNPYADTFRK